MAKLIRFRLEKRCRKANAGYAIVTQPDAVLAGTLTVTDPDTLRQALFTGIGRQRAFGCGMLRLKPVPMRAGADPVRGLASGRSEESAVGTGGS